MPACIRCGKRHNGQYQNPDPMDELKMPVLWHRCTGCMSVFCEDCAAELRDAGLPTPARLCPRCGNDTQTFEEWW